MLSPWELAPVGLQIARVGLSTHHSYNNALEHSLCNSLATIKWWRLWVGWVDHGRLRPEGSHHFVEIQVCRDVYHHVGKMPMYWLQLRFNQKILSYHVSSSNCRQFVQKLIFAIHRWNWQNSHAVYNLVGHWYIVLRKNHFVLELIWSKWCSITFF